jgi:Tol biopolymer transport system component
VSAPPEPIDRRAWINVALAAWLIGGVVLIARLNTQGIEPQSQRSIYVVPAYAGLAALAVYVVVAIGAAVRHRRPWRSAFAGGYELLPIGFAILVGYTAIDLAWVAWFGEEIGITEGLAPARLFLALGLALVAVGPVRAALRRAPGASRPAAAIALGLLLAVAVFPIGPLHPLVGAYATRPSDAIQDDSEIWLMAADGSRQSRLIAAGDGSEVSLPAWAPDGRSIAFTHWQRRDDGGAEADVWLADADGSDARSLVTGPGNDWIPAWSPDGAWIAYTAGSATPAQAPAGPLGVGPQPGQAPGAVTPHSASEQVWLVRPDGSDAHQLTDVEGGAAAAVWSPDGGSIAYSSERGGQSDIYVAAADGSGEVRLTDDPGQDWAPSWSRDGRHVLFTSDRTGTHDIWRVAIDGSELTRLTADGSDDDVAAEAPDGSRIAFVSMRSGDAEIWTMAPDGSDPQNLTRRPAADDGRWSVAWAPDGRSLAYASAGPGPVFSHPIVREDLAAAGAMLLAAAVSVAAVAAVAIGLRFGAVTIVLAVAAALAAVIGDQWQLVPAVVGVGLLVDLVATRLPPGRRRPVAAVLTPVGVVLAYGLTLLAFGSLAWSPTLLLGTAAAAGLIGWVIGVLLPAIEAVPDPPPASAT